MERLQHFVLSTSTRHWTGIASVTSICLKLSFLVQDAVPLSVSSFTELSILTWPTAVGRGYTQLQALWVRDTKACSISDKWLLISVQNRTEEMRNGKIREVKRESKKETTEERNYTQNRGKFSVFMLAVRPRKCLF
jgi:hypothetical protein